LAQVLDNLVGNAVKFTPPGGRVDVSCFAANGSVVVEVADTGVGIPEDELPQVFERFFRATSAARAEAPGTGLGLAISRTIVEAHGGSISVRSREGAGTTFHVELPVEDGGG
jgi:signal transduction histidine kinase